MLVSAVERCGYTGQVKFAIDPASEEFHIDDVYDLGFKDKANGGEKLTADELSDLYHKLLKAYPIVLLEDPYGQDDWPAWTKFHASSPIELVGDDLLATNIRRIEEAQERKACNGLLLKINQIGTITEAVKSYVPVPIPRSLSSSPTTQPTPPRLVFVLTLRQIVQGKIGVQLRLERFRFPPIRRDSGRFHC